MNIPNPVTKEFLKANPNYIFVFGDNLDRRGKGGAAVLRYEPNVYGFITKKHPTHDPRDYYTQAEYAPVFIKEMGKLIREIYDHPDKIYLISKLGAGLANRYHIYETIIEPGLRELEKMDIKNVIIMK